MLTTNNSPLINITDVVDAVNVNLPNLEHNKSYTLQQLVGKERWLSTHASSRKQLGIQFKALALSEVLPVHWAGSRPNHSQVYQLN